MADISVPQGNFHKDKGWSLSGWKEPVKMYPTSEIDYGFSKLREDLTNLVQGINQELSEAKNLIDQQRQTIEALSTALSRRIDTLPATIAADPNTVALLRTQLQAEFDQRYAPKAQP